MSNAEATGGQRGATFLLFVAVALPLTFGGVRASAYLSRLTCPESTTFLSGTTEPTLQLIGIVLVASAGAYLAIRVMLRAFPALTWVTGYPKAYSLPSKAGSLARLWLYLAAAGVAVGMIIVASTSFAVFCLGQGGIQDRSSIWRDPVRHDWADVVAIHTACSRGSRGRWNARYVLEMSDGAQIDIFTAEPRFGAGYPGLVQALRGKPIVFDSRYVAADCGHGDASYLFHPPQ